MSPAYRFHPEFGYFCPTPGFRYKLRVALLFMAIGGIAGIGGTLVLKAAHPPATETALTLARVDHPLSGGEAVPAATADHAEAATTGQRPRPPEGSKACEDDTWAYLDGKCVPGRPRKARTARPATGGPLISAIPLGSSSAPARERATEPAPAPMSGPDRRQQESVPTEPPTSVAAAAAADPAIAKPTEQAAAPKKKQKTARRQSKGRDHRVVSSAGRDGRARDLQPSARAYADDRSAQRAPFGGGGLFGGGGPLGSLFR